MSIFKMLIMVRFRSFFESVRYGGIQTDGAFGFCQSECGYLSEFFILICLGILTFGIFDNYRQGTELKRKLDIFKIGVYPFEQFEQIANIDIVTLIINHISKMI